jgi:hypothetical protein
LVARILTKSVVRPQNPRIVREYGIVDLIPVDRVLRLAASRSNLRRWVLWISTMYGVVGPQSPRVVGELNSWVWLLSIGRFEGSSSEVAVKDESFSSGLPLCGEE